MRLPLQISFQGMEHSDAIEASVRKHAAKIERFSEDIMACRVVVQAPHHHHHKGNLYHVSLDITLPGQEIAVTRDPEDHHSHEDVYVAIRDAFRAARRRLEDYARVRRGKSKRHETPLHGVISEVNPGADHGRITTADGREIYFHRNAVIGADLEKLEVGMEVRLVEEAGERGPQASTVKLIGKHHLV